MCKEVECLAKKFSDTLLFVGVGERDCVCVCVDSRGVKGWGYSVLFIHYCQQIPFKKIQHNTFPTLS